MSQEDVNIKRYVFVFSGYYAAFMCVINVLAYGFDIDLGSSANMAILIGSGYAAAIKFVVELGRAPSAKERRLLSLGCLLSSFIISALGVLIVIPVVLGSGAWEEISELFKTLSPLVWIAITLVIGLLYYFVLTLIFGWMAKKHATKTISA
ncbi:ABZJ_00895 family protein [Alkalimonas collagenimarina]|uniref:ABZJ_00895 family protein n=1 Tax=Alkalimonas collagenimarina TaxID=400390 RepID=A0ABT9H2E2_9GAMM|nr:ABZJ_00895 family protein [Alkalimonas collagenimarina]MDP4537476.1 ABZJ_00895 family protein [Alkalimonas collagenimarina]